MKAMSIVSVPEHIMRENFYVARRKKGFSRRELAQQVGLRGENLYMFETGQSWLSDPCKIMLANILEESVYHLFFEDMEDTFGKRMKLTSSVSKLKYIDIM